MGILLLLLFCPGAAAQARADSISVQLRRSTREELTLDVGYSHRATGDSATLTVRWYKKNGSTLPFTPAATRVGPGTGRVVLSARYRGVLGPPVQIGMRVLLLARGGRVLARQECALSLVTATGRTAWAGDLGSSRQRGLRWRADRCAPS
ncbi:MAG: hypothetical protein M3Z10_02110 [Gemmatimonadota bacterium]|nr:hypothetical protein [Gemmatimonadota bacterium]